MAAGRERKVQGGEQNSYMYSSIPHLLCCIRLFSSRAHFYCFLQMLFRTPFDWLTTLFMCDTYFILLFGHVATNFNNMNK